MPNTIGQTGLVIGCASAAYGYFTNISVTKPATEVVAKDGAGLVKGVAFTVEPWEAQVTITFLSDSGAPWGQVGTGTAVTFSDTELSGRNWYITNATMTKSNEEYKVWELTMKHYPNLGS
jgi:hypothetical protein